MCIEYLFGNLKAYVLKCQTKFYDNPNGMYDALVLTGEEVSWRQASKGGSRKMNWGGPFLLY